MRACFTRVTSELLDTSERLVLVLADIGIGSFREIGALERHPRRVLNVGIREQLMVGVASGFAIEGFRPILHSYAPFLVERPFEQLKLDLGHQGLGAILVSTGASYDAASEGRTHQCPGDVALLATLPGWKIEVPGHAEEVEACLRKAATGSDCVYIRLAERQNEQSFPGQSRLVPIRHGGEGAPLVVAVGPMMQPVLDATAGVDLSIAYLSEVRPFDAEGCRAMAGSQVVLVEPYLEGTTASEVAKALLNRPHRLLSIGVPLAERHRYGTPAEHDRALGLDAQGLRERILPFVGADR
ncbi:MAG: transketolase [Anaerolinea sp.]|nr:transketolase [Anaerolinea sp.]